MSKKKLEVAAIAYKIGELSDEAIEQLLPVELFELLKEKWCYWSCIRSINETTKHPIYGQDAFLDVEIIQHNGKTHLFVIEKYEENDGLYELGYLYVQFEGKVFQILFSAFNG